MPYIGNITQDFNVSNAMLDTDSVTSIKIVDGTIEGADIAANLDLSDSQKIRFGTGTDSEVSSDGTHTNFTQLNGSGYLSLNTDNFRVRKGDGSELIFRGFADAAVELYHNGVKKFETTANGVLTTGNIQLDSDSGKLTVGDSGDFEIYHNGTSTYLDNLTGHLIIRNNVGNDENTNIYIKAKQDEDGIVINDDAGVELYYDNSKKFETTSAGNEVFGNIVVGTVTLDGGGLSLSDNDKLKCGNGDDLQIYHSGSHSYIADEGVGELIISGSRVQLMNAARSGKGLDFVEGSSGYLRLYQNNTIRLETTSTGVTVAGALATTSLSATGGITGTGGNFILGDSSGTSDDRIKLGASGDLHIYHDGTDTYVSNATGDLRLFSVGGSADDVMIRAQDDIQLQPDNGDNGVNIIGNGSVELYYDNSKKFETNNGGVQVIGDLRINDNENIYLGDGADLHITVGANDDGVINQANGDLKFQRAGSGKFSIKSTGTHFSDDAFWADSQKAIFGAGSDLQIYHDGTNSVIADEGTGALVIKSNQIDFIDSTSTEFLARFFENSAVELYFDSSKKLETNSQGITIPDGNGLTINGGTGNRTGDAVLYVDKTNNNDWTAKFKTNSGSSSDYGLRIECDSGSSFPLAINSGSDVFRVSGSGAVYATEYQGSGLTLSGVHKSYAILLEKLSDVDVGTFTSGAYRTRNLNTELDDPDGIVSLSSNQFTLTAGTYIIRWSCSAFQVDHHSTRIAHISGTVTNGGTEVGSSEYSNNGSEITNRSVGVSLQACANSCVYEIQHRCTQTINGNGFGVRTMFGADTVATIVEIFKIA